MRKLLTVLSLLVVVVFLNVATFARGHFDDLSVNTLQTIRIGEWTVPEEVLNEDLETAFMLYFGAETLEELYSNPTFQDIMYTVASNSTGGGVSAEDVEYSIDGFGLGNYSWRVDGFFNRQSGNISLGFVRQINRLLENGTTAYPLFPPQTNDPEEAFFTAYDIKNSLTDNQFGFRLENRSQITTMEPIQDLSAISFYALRGLLATNNERLSARNIEVLISPTGEDGTFVSLGTQLVENPPSANEVYNPNNPVSHPFPYYTFTLTENQQTNAPEDGYYIRIIYYGQAQGSGRNATRSRVVIDQLTIHTNT